MLPVVCKYFGKTVIGMQAACQRYSHAFSHVVAFDFANIELIIVISHNSEEHFFQMRGTFPGAKVEIEERSFTIATRRIIDKLFHLNHALKCTAKF